MASLHQHQHQSNYDRVFFGPIFSDSRRQRGSTSQMCLHKILSIITTVPPPLSTASPPFSETKESSAENDSSDENKVSGFDLNVGFCISPELKESFEEDNNSGLSFSSTNDGFGGGSAVRDGGCFKVNLENDRDRVEKEESSHIKIEEAEKSLTLLIEAATLIFGEFKDDNKPEPEKHDFGQDSDVKKEEVAADIELNERKYRPRSSSCCTGEEMGGEFDENPVRSTRGRTRILPCKYKDSVLEPLTRPSRPRSSIPPSKRRRR
ncbi:hypothetical protein CDL12_16515 [Handroanthus impetiginosus]|uniref:Uncharacterized protein n=1 Tax=Handroanthus impetiginosus TaxID=429701 RepID=A0A2G9H038_9LAMI|nr:hypothetical protein CDL12_16515 [Handroanthus impetiginosus]